MKQKDIATLALIVGLSIVVSVVISNLLITSPKNRQQKVEIVEKLSSNFDRPDDKVFNKEAINPTQTVRIQTGQDGNPLIFSN